jgi:hypothetical protein
MVESWNNKSMTSWCAYRRPTSPPQQRTTLLNTGYKILARITANQLRPTLSDKQHPSQYCAVTGNTIFDAVATVWDAVAYAELTHAPLCILSLDFTAAFDRISHIYRLRMLKNYGYSMNFIKLLLLLYFIMSLFSNLTLVRFNYSVN